MLCFRYHSGGEAIETLQAIYQYNNLEPIIHNGSHILYVHYSPHFLRIPSMSEVNEHFTTAKARELHPGPKAIIIVDNTEKLCQSSTNLGLQTLLFSSKIKRCLIKIALICATNGTILYVSPIFGGAASEGAPYENFQRSAPMEWQTTPYIALADRGYGRKHFVPGSNLTLILPAFLEGGQFTARQVLDSQVTHCLEAGISD